MTVLEAGICSCLPKRSLLEEGLGVLRPSLSWVIIASIQTSVAGKLSCALHTQLQFNPHNND